MRAYQQPGDLFRDTWVHSQKTEPQLQKQTAFGSNMKERMFGILPSLDGQTTFKSDETKSATSVSERASQRFKNHVDTTSVLRENFKKPKETGQKDPPTDQQWGQKATPSPGGRLI